MWDVLYCCLPFTIHYSSGLFKLIRMLPPNSISLGNCGQHHSHKNGLAEFVAVVRRAPCMPGEMLGLRVLPVSRASQVWWAIQQRSILWLVFISSHLELAGRCKSRVCWNIFTVAISCLWLSKNFHGSSISFNSWPTYYFFFPVMQKYEISAAFYSEKAVWTLLFQFSGNPSICIIKLVFSTAF